MDIQSYVEQMKGIQNSILTFIEDEDEDKQNQLENFMIFQNLFEKLQIQEDKHKFELLIRLISKISNNHFRCTNFFEKLKQILSLIRNQISEYFSNLEILHFLEVTKELF